MPVRAIVEVYSGSQRVTYVKVNTDKIDEIIYRHLIGNLVEKYTIGAVLKNGEDNDVLSIEDTAFINTSSALPFATADYRPRIN